MTFDGMIQMFKYFPREILALVQVVKIFDKLATGHFPSNVLGVQICVQ